MTLSFESLTFYFLKEDGFYVKVGKDITVCQAGRDRGIKLARNFGENYTLDAICNRILTQMRLSDSPAQTRTNHIKIRLNGDWKKTKRIGGLRGLYLHYCYSLGIIPKNESRISPAQMRFILREDLLQFEKVKEETKLLCKYHIDTDEQLFLFQKKYEDKISLISDARKHLRYKVRRMHGEQDIAGAKKEISNYTKQLNELRKEVRLCEGIAKRSGVIKDRLAAVREENIKGKEQPNEYKRRSR